LLNFTQVQVKVQQSDVYLSKSAEVFVFKSTSVSRVHFLNIALLLPRCLYIYVQKRTTWSFETCYEDVMLWMKLVHPLRKFQKIHKMKIVWRGGVTGWHIPRMDLLRLHPLFHPWFCLLSKSDHGVYSTLAER